MKDEALELHASRPGKISVETAVDVETAEDLGLVYTPGVAEPCRKIESDSSKSYSYTSRGNLVAVVSDGSAVLGLGDIGPEASMPVMEGKANLMKEFGEVDGFPICLDSEGADELAEEVMALEPTFGAVNLEDIKAPRCFRVEERLKSEMDVPVFHDDQHGTAIVVGAALRNALDLVDRDLESSRVVVLGAGASGIAVSEFLLDIGVGELLVVDSSGIISPDDENEYKSDLAGRTESSAEEGGLSEALEGADALIGLSTGGIVSRDHVSLMADDPVVFALANPDPEIMPGEAKAAGAEIVATGRSDFDNQVNNSLAFPGVFRGALDAEAMEINEEMKRAASDAIRGFIEPEKDRIVPETLEKDLAMEIAEKVEQAAVETAETR
ncbi:MAG: NADP-dependent malic enzyme [Candidatus Nanohaloarchaea archaeon]